MFSVRYVSRFQLKRVAFQHEVREADFNYACEELKFTVMKPYIRFLPCPQFAPAKEFI